MTHVDHGWRHAPKALGGTDPTPGLDLGGGTVFGSWTQQVPLWYFDALDMPAGLDQSGFDWVTDNAYRGCGYVGATANGSYFSWLVNLSPKGSVWQVMLRAAGDVDYGRLTIALASLAYESDARPSGDTAGKIAPVDGAYGSFTYVDLTPNQECYNAAGFNEQVNSASWPFIIDGEEGDPLTVFDTGPNDPYTGFPLADGGPGWYRLKVRVNGKNAASSGHKARITDVRISRRADDNAP